ncbi:centrosomal protein of 85 kDa [Procambarus clarkii]|uniref:centrosomal protein of 85 kDa n=1 Tax=Procambarus clarkii TaxID=6728 RepID=UPI001E678FC4|nr:centrosomal protein of 85 kDa-like [Procambarus clarkii]
MEPEETGKWNLLQRKCRHRGYRPGAGGHIGSDVGGMVPSALVHPFPSSEKDCVLDNETSSCFMHSFQNVSANLSSPYLLSTQTPSPVAPLHRVMSPPSITLNLDHVVHCSPNTQTMDLKSLHYQVQEIQNKLSGDVTGSKEFQELLSEKLNLEKVLGSTEYSLKRIMTAYNDLKKNTSASEQEFLLKLDDIQEKYRALGERHSVTKNQLTRMNEYLKDLPTLNEHQQLQQEIANKSAQISHISSKVEHLSQQVKKLAKKESEQEAIIEGLTRERDDFSLKLNLAENLMKELENQREASSKEGEYSKEDLLWTLDQQKKELESAGKLLTYRKQKLQSFQKELVMQDKKHAEKLQAEVDLVEKLKETVWQLERELEQHKQTEEVMKNKLASAEEKQKKLEERLEMAVEQVTSNSKMSSLIKSLLTNLHIAVKQLRDMVTISHQISKGTSPDMSLLLSFSDFSEDIEGENFTNDGLTAKLKEVRSLIHQLEEARTHLQEQYAHQLAKDVTCAQM